MLQVGLHYFFFMWCFSPSIFPSSSRIETREVCLVCTCHPVRPLLGLPHSHCWDPCFPSGLLHFGPCLHTATRHLWAPLWPSPGWCGRQNCSLPLGHHPIICFVHLLASTAVCEVWVIVLPAPVRSITLATSHICFLALVPQPDALFLLPTPTLINSMP